MELLRNILNENSKEQYIANAMGEKLLQAARRDQSLRNSGALQVGSLGVGDQFPAEHGPELALKVVQLISQADPTPNKAYLQWLVRQYVGDPKRNVPGAFKYEDLTKIKNELGVFTKHKAKIQNKDLNSYKTLNDLYNVTEPLQGVDPEMSKRQHDQMIKSQGADQLFNTPGMKIYHLKNQEAANFYASGTKWCTSSENGDNFRYYADQGMIFVIILPQEIDEHGRARKFQLHFESGQVMNERDIPISKQEIAMLSKYPAWAEFLNHLINKHYKL